MMTIIKTDSSNADFLSLVALLDADLAIRDGDEHVFYAKLNKVDAMRHVLVAYMDNRPVGCGAIKPFAEGAMEVKRMYTLPEYRGKGIASTILNNLEAWVAELGCSKCVLETGQNQPEAIAMYHKCGYQRIPNYGHYVGVANSVCFEKLV